MMKPHYHEVQSRLPSKVDFAEYFLTKTDDLILDAYQVTIDHKTADSPKAANASLKKFLPVFLRRTISSHWHRHRDQFELHAFLDVPGSRRSPRPSPYRVASQAAFHHHCIMLMSGKLSQRFQQKCLNYMPDDPYPDDEATMSDFRRSFAKSSTMMFKRLQFMAGHAVLDFRNTTSVRSCCVQPLDEKEDIERTGTYAAKSVKYLSKVYSDEAYLIFPLYTH